MQGLISHPAFTSSATKAALTSASRAGSTAAFRPSTQKAQKAGKTGLSHNARSFQAAAAGVEAAPAPVVTTAPSV
jgi:hypothetical protein